MSDPTSSTQDFRSAELTKVSSESASENMLSVIVRFHDFARLRLLGEALFSLAVQSWHNLETLVMIQNGGDDGKAACIDLINQLPWLNSPPYQVISVPIPEGVDGRSTLLNRGIERANGRYLAILDDDDLIYQHGYETLIQQLNNCEAAVAVGGCRMSRMKWASNHWYVSKKENPWAWGQTRDDLLADNFVPIHSYVIDRKRINPRDLYFDDAMPPLEDYDLLLRLVARYTFDFSRLNTPVCEYRIHGRNSIPYEPEAGPEAQWFVRAEAHRRATRLIEERKNNLQCLVPVPELIDLKKQLTQLKAEQARLTQEFQVKEEAVAELVSKVAEKETQLQRISGSVGWRLISRYGPIKYRLVVPTLMTIKRLLRPELRNGNDPDQ